MERVFRGVCGGIFRVDVQGLDGYFRFDGMHVVYTRFLYDEREQYSKSGTVGVLRIRLQQHFQNVRCGIDRGYHCVDFVRDCLDSLQKRERTVKVR